VEAFQQYPTGSPGNPIPVEVLYEKFRNFARRALPEQRIERIIQTVERLEELSDIRELVSLLTVQA
jgi:2-methylcitrate dehydratase PrpD